jgi:hypothetical protein
MFRQSTTTTQPDLFSNFLSSLGGDGRRHKKFTDRNAWHNLFREFITCKVNEKRFSCLFSGDMGRPNVPVRILAGMMILKESSGWSDERLFEEIEFNILAMSALGMNNASDEAPCAATYYNFRKALYEYQLQTGEDLVGEMFRELTQTQAKLFGVHGKFTRMDSKLIGSNICKSSRLQLIISVLQTFFKDISQHECKIERMEKKDRQVLLGLMKKTGGQIVYALDNQSREQMLEELGYILLRLQQLYTGQDSSKYHLIVRVLSEQYRIEGEQIRLCEIREIKSDSLQSPHDEDAAYRKKGEQKVQGYSANITETCNNDTLNLITDVQVEKANHADNDFLQKAVEQSEKVVGHIENVNADGAYHSPDNQEFAKDNSTSLVVGNMQGKKGKYAFEVEENEDRQVTVINTETGEVQKAEEYKEGRYKIRENGQLKYFSLAMILAFFQRQQIERFSQEAFKRRNNVEASIFQLSYFTRKNKTRYRGKVKHQWWAYNRCMWVNLVRIRNWMGEVCPDGTKMGEIEAILTKNAGLLIDFFFSMGEKLIFSTLLSKKSMICPEFCLISARSENYTRKLKLAF